MRQKTKKPKGYSPLGLDFSPTVDGLFLFHRGARRSDLHPFTSTPTEADQ
jgi:hypothetical protein